MTVRAEQPVVAFLTGATAVGKSAVALALAQRHGWEIVSIDSRQVYRGLDIGTAKPSAEERARVRHHLLDLLEPAEVSSAGWFCQRYADTVVELARRGARALAVGGTGLYWEAATLGLHELPPASPEIRAELESMRAREGAPRLYERLQELDPEGARRIDRHNPHRVMRALELVLVTGRGLDELYAGRRTGPAGRPLATPPAIVLTRPREETYARIAARCAAMIEAGLVAEIRALLDSGVSPAAPGLRTVGYRELLPHLLSGAPLDGCLREFVSATRRYAKRQETWFRNRLAAGRELVLDAGEGPSAIGDRVERLLGVAGDS